MPHPNARLTVHGRRLLIDRVRAGRPVAHVADEMGVSRATAHKWVRRRRAEGDAGLYDRPSRPRTTPHRHRCARKQQPVIGYSFVHTAVDDHSRLAYSEVLTNARKETAAAFWLRANAFFTAHGITVERVLTDNGSCYRSKLFAWTLSADGITHQPTRPYRPQTNGKVERLNRTLLDEWAYARPYSSNAERTKALADFLHTYNHHRGHTALGGRPPISRVNDAAGQYT